MCLNFCITMFSILKTDAEANKDISVSVMSSLWNADVR